MEHIPEHISDWVEHFPFGSLTPNQQKNVLQYITAETYTEMHQVAKLLHAGESSETSPDENVRVQLLQHFDKLYPAKKQRTGFLHTPMPLWRVAASWVVLAACLTLLLTNICKETPVACQTIHDTLYITRPAQTITQLVRDTIYMVRESIRENTNPPVTQTGGALQDIALTDTGTQQTHTVLHPTDIHFLQVKDKDLLLNNKRGNPIRDDSLLKIFEFVRIL